MPSLSDGNRICLKDFSSEHELGEDHIFVIATVFKPNFIPICLYGMPLKSNLWFFFVTN